MKRCNRLTLTGTILVLAACASAPPGSTSTVNVVVENNLIPSGTVAVYLLPQSGIERLLGTVTSSGRQVLVYRGLPPVGDHRLVARTTSGRSIISNTFVMDGVLGLEWSLASNLVRVTQTQAREL